MENTARHIRLRWTATVQYKDTKELPDLVLPLDELRDLHDIIEQGPDWNLISQITVVYNP